MIDRLRTSIDLRRHTGTDATSPPPQRLLACHEQRRHSGASLATCRRRPSTAPATSWKPGSTHWHDAIHSLYGVSMREDGLHNANRLISQR